MSATRALHVLALLLLLPRAALAQGEPDALDRARARGHLLWGADPEGGAPYAFADPEDPSRTVGFEVDIANEIGREIGLPVELKPLNWASIYQDLGRGEVDFGMNGLEVNDETRQQALFSRPYYIFSEQLVVRATEDHIQALPDVAGHPAGTLGGTMAERMLSAAGAEVRTYDGQVEPYDDLELGRVDAVLLDLPITLYYADAMRRPTLRWTSHPVGRGEYAIAVAPGEAALHAALDAALSRMIADGRLARILTRWRLWDERQWSLVRPEEAGPLAGLFDATRAVSEPAIGPETPPALPGGEAEEEPRFGWLWRHGPLLLDAALTTIWVSTLSMAIAIALGLPLAIGRLYGGALLRTFAAGYVELFRGTPVMLQLYVIYYGLPHVPGIGLELPAWAAALLGLGLNYAAYEAEIYRAGLQAVPVGQMEAALSLGMTRGQAIRRILVPQAVRIVLPPVTNDFVSLLKDSSIVSVIAIHELTKRFYILGRSDVDHFVHLAAATAALYLIMSYPLGAWSRRMERKLGVSRP